MRRAFTVPLGVLLLAGCTQSSDSTALAPADLMRGELLSLACQACHTLGAGQAHLLGPNLYGVFGQTSARKDDFEYSPALRSAELVWTPAALEAWLANPEEFLPGNNMVFAGYDSATDRRDLIAFLLHNTGGFAQ